MATQKQVDELREILEEIVAQGPAAAAKATDDLNRDMILDMVKTASDRIASPTFDEYHLGLSEAFMIEQCRSSRNALANVHILSEPWPRAPWERPA